MEKYRSWLLVLVLFGCQTRMPVAADTIRLALGAEPDTLNPLLASDAYASRILDLVNDTLIDRNPDTLAFEPHLAERWQVSSDNLRYTFYLRKNVHWQDGQPFTADDVVYSFQKIKDPSVQAPFLRVYYSDVVNVEKLDDYTVRFVYSRPYFLGLSVCGSIPLVPKHLYDVPGSDFAKNPLSRSPVGLGPYRFVSWKTNRKLVLTRNDDYWGKKPEIKTIEFRIVTDDAVLLQLLKKGEVDMASLRPIQWVRQTGAPEFDKNFAKYKYLLPGFNYIAWNNKSPFFEDPRVRQAMTLLIDRKKMLEKLEFGLGEVVETPFFPKAPQYNTSLAPYPYDPEKAQALLREAGWADHDGDGFLDKDGKKFDFNFLYPAEAKFTERMATILKEDLKNIGIEVTIQRIEWAAFLQRLDQRKFDATSLGWSTSFEGDPYQIWHSSQAKIERGSNFISFENPEADGLIEQARQTFDEKRRNALYWRFQQIVYDGQPYTFLFSNYSLVTVSRRFSNIIVHTTGLDLKEWKIR